MKSKKINLSELKIQSFVTSLSDSKELNINFLKGGTSEDETAFSKLEFRGCVALEIEP